jgi:D-aminoacyl-tRNA deacylase
MRIVIQRVSEALVMINHKVNGAIKNGLMILAGFEDADTEEDIEWMSKKIIQLRIFNDAEGLMNFSVKDTQGDILLVSQFTLHAATKKGNRPSYIKAIPLYEKFIQQLTQDLGKPIATGIFGADMKVSLINDGPVTIIIDSKNKE